MRIRNFGLAGFWIWLFGSGFFGFYKILVFEFSVVQQIEITKISSVCNVDKSTSAPF